MRGGADSFAPQVPSTLPLPMAVSVTLCWIRARPLRNVLIFAEICALDGVGTRQLLAVAAARAHCLACYASFGRRRCFSLV
jgi:hypothetical protein